MRSLGTLKPKNSCIPFPKIALGALHIKGNLETLFHLAQLTMVGPTDFRRNLRILAAILNRFLGAGLPRIRELGAPVQNKTVVL
jgi:hypothetical protein